MGVVFPEVTPPVDEGSLDVDSDVCLPPSLEDFSLSSYKYKIDTHTLIIWGERKSQNLIAKNLQDFYLDELLFCLVGPGLVASHLTLQLEDGLL